MKLGCLLLLGIAIVCTACGVSREHRIRTIEQAIERYKETNHYNNIAHKLSDRVECHGEGMRNNGWLIYIGEVVMDTNVDGHIVRWDTILVMPNGTVWENADQTQLDDEWTIPVR